MHEKSTLSPKKGENQELKKKKVNIFQKFMQPNYISILQKKLGGTI